MEPVPTLHFGPFSLDGPDDGLWCGPERCKLTAKAEAVLRYLIARPGHLVRKADLLAAVWPDVYVNEWVLTTCIREIRHVLGDVAKAPQYIATVHRQGYRFIAPVTNGATPVACEALPSAPPVAALEAEHKLVTLLCGALAEAPALAARLGPERWYRLLQRVAELTQEVLLHYGGTLILSTGDGFTAVFGAPVAQEDHARRAVMAAQELRQRLHDAPALHPSLAGSVLRLGLGLHTGRVVVGGLGLAPQLLATAVGVPLHLATRLQQQAAPGTILLSAATYQLVHAEIRATPCGTLTLDGQPAPVSVYAVQGLLGRHAGVAGRGPRAQSPFVGRERELALLQEHLAEAMTGQGHVLGLVGAPGMGKTRLLTEFCRRVPGNQVRVYAGQCLSYGQGTPYLPVRDLVRQVCELAEGAEVAEHATAVQQRLHASGITSEDDVVLLLQLLDLPVAAENLARLSPEARQVRTFALLRHLILDTAQRQPLVLVVENLHWIDPTSEAWLASLVERLSGEAVLLLGTYRPGYQPTWGAHAAVTQIALPPLRVPESWTVIQSVLGEMSLPETRMQALVAQAGGNPFFLEELAWHAVEQGGWDTPEAVPETVHAVLAARMDRLPLEAKHLLQTATVIGPEVPVSLLQAIAEVPEAAMHRDLEHLQAAEFLYEARLFPEQVYTFKHALTHEVAYGSLLQKRQRTLHARIVKVLETLPPDRLGEQVDTLAHHARRGEVWDKALMYFRQAGEKALAQSAYREAVAAFEQALGTLQHLPESRAVCEQAIDLRIDLCFALWRLGNWREALDRLREAEALAERLGDQRRLAHVSSELADGCRILSDYERALTAGQRALTLAIALEDKALQAEANTQLGLIYYHRGDYGRAIAALRQTVTALARHSYRKRDGRPDAPAVWAWSWLLVCLAQVGAFAEGHAMRADLLRLAEATAYPFDLAVATFGVGQLSLRQGALAQAIAVFERGLAVCQRHDLHDWLPTLAARVGYAYALAGRLPEALTLLEQAVGQGEAMRGGSFPSASVIWLGEASLFAGRLEEAHTLAERALVLAREHQERGNQAYALHLLGDIAAHREPPQVGQAEAHYHRALALAEELGMRPLQAHCHLGLGRLCAQTGQREQARTALTTAIDLYRAMDMAFWLHQAEAALAQVA